MNTLQKKTATRRRRKNIIRIMLIYTSHMCKLGNANLKNSSLLQRKRKATNRTLPSCLCNIIFNVLCFRAPKIGSINSKYAKHLNCKYILGRDGAGG